MDNDTNPTQTRPAFKPSKNVISQLDALNCCGQNKIAWLHNKRLFLFNLNFLSGVPPIFSWIKGVNIGHFTVIKKTKSITQSKIQGAGTELGFQIRKRSYLNPTGFECFFNIFIRKNHVFTNNIKTGVWSTSKIRIKTKLFQPTSGKGFYWSRN